MTERTATESLAAEIFGKMKTLSNLMDDLAPDDNYADTARADMWSAMRKVKAMVHEDDRRKAA